MLHKHQIEWESIIIKPNISSLPFNVKSASQMGMGGTGSLSNACNLRNYEDCVNTQVQTPNISFEGLIFL